MSKNHVPSFMLLSRNAQFLAKSALLYIVVSLKILDLTTVYENLTIFADNDMAMSLSAKMVSCKSNNHVKD